MGGAQSVRATHFTRPPTPAQSQFTADPEEHHISISNKMVERLVEDATLAGGAAVVSANTAPVPRPRGDYKEKIYMEKIKCLDDSHSEKYKITVDDLNSLACRIEMRTDNMVTVEPVCGECKQHVIDCYADRDPDDDDVIKCWDAIGAFTKCVQDAGIARLRARTQREAREHARRERHVAHAREHDLKELGPPPQAQES